MKLNYLKQIVALVAILGTATGALAQYVWIDKDGVKKFSDTAPPADIPQKNILKQPHITGSKPAAASDSASADDADDKGTAKKEPTLAEKNAEYNKRRLEKAEKDKKAAEAAKQQENKDQNCANAKKYLDTLKSGMRVSTTDSNGGRSYMSDDERSKEEARAQAQLDECNK